MKKIITLWTTTGNLSRGEFEKTALQLAELTIGELVTFGKGYALIGNDYTEKMYNATIERASKLEKIPA